MSRTISPRWSAELWKLTTYCTICDRRVKCVFILTLACFPSMTATHELVVPRSMPMTAPLTASDLQHIYTSITDLSFKFNYSVLTVNSSWDIYFIRKCLLKSSVALIITEYLWNKLLFKVTNVVLTSPHCIFFFKGKYTPYWLYHHVFSNHISSG